MARAKSRCKDGLELDSVGYEDVLEAESERVRLLADSAATAAVCTRCCSLPSMPSLLLDEVSRADQAARVLCLCTFQSVYILT